MATWNKEYYVALEGRDLQANAMAVDNTGTYVLLAGRRYIAMRNLDEDMAMVHKFPRQSKYDVGSAEWNPTSHKKELCVISSNQRLEVFMWRAAELTQTHSLRAHTRVITDLNWHRSEPDLLASCSVDTFIHLWDLRDARRPTLSLSAIAEATQVRWNRISPYLLATAHDGDVKVWDRRNGSAPIHYISAHLQKIHGLDWHPQRETQLVTSSQDNTVKFFETTNPRRAESVLTTNAPVWRARYTPFGNGLITVVVPQIKRGENSLLLWNTTNRSTHMHAFLGHRDVVLEFEWRTPRTDSNDYQLITWSRDQTLLVWKIEAFLQKLCGHEPKEDPLSSGDVIEEKCVEPKIRPLEQEFSLVNVSIANLEVHKMDANARACTVSATVNSLSVVVRITFPNAYPHGVPPLFRLAPNTGMNEAMVGKVLHTMNHLARQHVSKNRTCLEPCLRQLVATMEQLAADMDDDRAYKVYDTTNYDDRTNVLGGYNDAYIPFPRTSGARFSSVGILVCFGRNAKGRRSETTTPRALSALETLPHNKRVVDDTTPTVSAYYYQKPRNRSTKHQHHTMYRSANKATVHIYDVSALFLVNRQLAEEYILDGDVGTVCKHNAGAAAIVGRWDLVQAWSLAELIVTTRRDADGGWNAHPFGDKLTRSLIMHYAQHSDIQMAAMLACIFGKKIENNEPTRKTSIRSLISPGSTGSPYHTIPPADVIADGWVFPTMKKTRSTSLDNIRLVEPCEAIRPQITTSHPPSLYEYYKLSYASLLHRWDLLYNRAEVLKYMQRPSDAHKGVEFVIDCRHCQKSSKNCTCIGCKRIALNCVICHVGVRGSAVCCILCGHGGHTGHLIGWFEKNEQCPSGCGCRCLVEMAHIFSC